MGRSGATDGLHPTGAGAGESPPLLSPVVRMRGIVKRFGPVLANAGVDFELARGEVHALLGENGAGKTTLMNVLYGLIQPDGGTIEVEGAPVRLRSPHEAMALGIGMVHQHFKLVPTLTVAENVVLPERGRLLLRRADLEAVAERLRALGRHHGLEVSPEAQVWQLSVGEQQRVEILRALYREVRVLILDEPTAALTPREVEQLLPRLRALASTGTSIVVITHHLDEVMEVADRITVLRQGRRVATLRPWDTTTPELARLMVGREVSVTHRLAVQAAGTVGPEEVALPAGPARPPAPPVLEASDLRAVGDRGTPALDGVSFRVGRGEVVAIAGVEGNGQAELEEVLFGLRRVQAGTIHLDGEDVTAARPGARLRRGMAMVPSDRYRRGLIRALSVAENLVLDRIDRPPYGTPLRLNRRAILDSAVALIRRFSIRVSRPTVPAGTLSGGNAQRVVLARNLSRSPAVLVAAQPTRGLDVGAIEFVWDQIRAQRDAGAGVLLVSTDLAEVMALADRCHVMYRGRLVAHWPRAAFDRERMGLAMGGALHEPEAAPAPPGDPGRSAVAR